METNEKACNHPKNKYGKHLITVDEKGNKYCFYCGVDYIKGWNGETK